jgi:peptidoglycan glycosyltransferase
MDHRIRWVGGVMLLCFGLLFLQLNNIQVHQAKALDNNPLNQSPQQVVNLFRQPRGEILSSDGYVLAQSVPVKGKYHFKRVYPALTAQAFGNLTGYYDAAVEADPFGIEGFYNQYLSYHQSPVHSLGSLLTQHNETDNVILTISAKLQLAAEQSLAAAAQPGSAIVAIDPRSGDILAMAGYPTYDPNLLDSAKALPTYSDPKADPIFNIPTYSVRFPGSTFKTITTAAMFDHDPALTKAFYKQVSTYTFPNSGKPPITLQNYGGSSCGGNMAQILAFSCDTAYSEIGVKLGARNLALEAHSFGFDSGIPIDFPSSEVSPAQFPSPAQINATPYVGYSAIGQFDDQASALSMALVASGLANNGVIMTPHLGVEAANDTGQVEWRYQPHPWRRATSSATANSVRKLMTGVTQMVGGTAYGLFQSYYAQSLPTIAAKTGTAEPTKNVCGTYNWLIAFGPAGTNETPSVAMAAVVPIPSNSSSCLSNPTGASIAGPVLLPVLEQALALQGSK